MAKNYTLILKIIPRYIITSYLAGDYFQALRNITVPAKPMVRKQSSLIITLEWEHIVPSHISLENRNF